MSSPLKTAHRGDSSIYRENTLDAVRSAISTGADIVEVDVRQSSDGVVILLHDRTLERLWGYAEDASNLSFAQISHLGFGDIRIPTLADALKLFQGSSVSIMIDMDTPDHAQAAFRVVESSEIATEQVIWCGDLEAMRLIRNLSSAARIWLPWNSHDGLNWSLVDEINPECINSHYSFWNREKIAQIQARGLKTSAWTIDDLPTLTWAKSIGIDSVTSNQLALTCSVFEDESEVDPLDLRRARIVCESLARWALMLCEMMAPGEVLTKVNAADLVTEVDLLIERHAREVILANFPTHNIVGEEFGGNFEEGQPTWYIDPVDGTTNFANRTPWSSFSLALALNRTPLVAATIDPWRNKLFTAVKDAGAYVNGERLLIAQTLSDSQALAGKVVLTELAGSAPWQGLRKFLDGLNENFCTMRIMGAGTLTLTSPSAGYGIGALVHSFSPIDHLAAALIGKEAGCLVLNEMGEEDLFPDTGGMMIVAPVAREALFKIWKAALEG